MCRAEVRGLKQQNRTPNDYSFLNAGEEEGRKEESRVVESNENDSKTGE